MARSSDAVWARRVNAARASLQEAESLAAAAAALVRAFAISKRQAYRYLHAAQTHRTPIPVPARKIAFTVKLPERLIQDVRVWAHTTGHTVSEVVTQALVAFLRTRRPRG